MRSSPRPTRLPPARRYCTNRPQRGTATCGRLLSTNHVARPLTPARPARLRPNLRYPPEVALVLRPYRIEAEPSLGDRAAHGPVGPLRPIDGRDVFLQVAAEHPGHTRLKNLRKGTEGRTDHRAPHGQRFDVHHSERLDPPHGVDERHGPGQEFASLGVIHRPHPTDVGRRAVQPEGLGRNSPRATPWVTSWTSSFLLCTVFD